MSLSPNLQLNGTTKSDRKKRKASTSQSNNSQSSKSSKLSDVTSTMTTTSTPSTSTGSYMLMQRTSSFDALNICEHCVHDHMKTCCLYVYDNNSDINNYSSFKREVESPYWIGKATNDEFSLFIGGTTPKDFPLYSENDQERIAKKVNAQSKLNVINPNSVVYVRQYFWPLFLPEPAANNPYDNFIRNHGMNPCAPTHTTPCVMRQVVVPVDKYYGQNGAINSISSNKPHVIETHSWVPWWLLHQK